MLVSLEKYILLFGEIYTFSFAIIIDSCSLPQTQIFSELELRGMDLFSSISQQLDGLREKYFDGDCSL